MSTRSLVGKFTNAECTTWEAMYCHFDGYPSAVGNAILENWLINFEGNTAAIASILLSSEKGWSALAGTDFRKPPTWNAADDQPKWYDDRDVDPGGAFGIPLTTQDTWKDSWCEYAYLFDTSAHNLHIFCLHGRKFTPLGIYSKEAGWKPAPIWAKEYSDEAFPVLPEPATAPAPDPVGQVVKIAATMTSKELTELITYLVSELATRATT